MILLLARPRRSFKAHFEVEVVFVIRSKRDAGDLCHQVQSKGVHYNTQL